MSEELALFCPISLFFMKTCNNDDMNAFGAEDREKEEKRFRGVEEVEKKKKQKRETRGPLKNTKSKKKKTNFVEARPPSC